MRFLIMHKETSDLETGLPPPKAILEGVGQLVGESIEQKTFLGGAGLKPSSTRVRIVYKGGKRTITEGPFADAQELVGGFAQMKVRSRNEAIGWCDRFAALIGDVELYMGPVVERWDLGIAPKPENPPLRFLSLHKLNERGENDTPADPRLMAEMGALIEEMTKAGVLEATGVLASTKKGARVHFAGGKQRVIDGPFAESKELVAGYSLLELPSKAAAIAWAIRLGEITKVDEVEVREMEE